MASAYHQEVEKRLMAKGIILPEAMMPVANYVPFKVSGDFLYISGQLPMDEKGELVKGLCGESIETAAAAHAAERSAVGILSQAKAALDDFQRIKGLTKLTGFVASTPTFADHPMVINGASNLMVDALGERGKHARSAVGSVSLPFGVCVEVEAIFEIAD